MHRYPYRCLEQRVSRAVALHDAALWREIATEIVNADGVVDLREKVTSAALV